MSNCRYTSVNRERQTGWWRRSKGDEKRGLGRRGREREDRGEGKINKVIKHELRTEMTS